MVDSVKPHISHKSFLTLLKGTLADRILLAVSLAAIAAAWIIVQAVVASGPAVAEVYHGKVLLATYPLPLAGEPAKSFQIEGELGTSEILLDADGVRMLSSPCSAQRCVYSGAHRHAGDMIACVPNRILITIRGSAKSRFDAIVE